MSCNVKRFSTGDKIKKYRKIKGITQEKLAELIDVSDSQIRKYELGIRKPKYERMLEIAKALEISVYLLIDHSINSEEDVLTVLDEIKEHYGIDIIKKYLEMNK